MAGKYEAEKLLAKRANREDPIECLSKFLKNISEFVRFKHDLLAEKPNPDVVKTLIRIYLISVTSCLETFYRDLFRYLLEDSGRLFFWGNISERKKMDLLSAGLSEFDIQAEYPSLQSSESIFKTLDPFFPSVGYQNAISLEGLRCIIPSKKSDVALFKLPEDWGAQFDDIFQARHRYVHDANSLTDTSVEEIQKFEALAVILPQITTWKLDSVMRFAIKGEEGADFPVILLADDLCADDWIVK